MSESLALHTDDPVFKLNQAFMLNQPREAARLLEALQSNAAAEILQNQQTYIISMMRELRPPGAA